jgi:diacylglycerol O-acyltransferase / wax synthase
MRQLTFMDEMFLFMETPRTPAHIAPFMVYDPSTAPGGRMTFKDILAAMERRLPLADCFREKLVRVPLGLDNSYWAKDDDFDLEFHVREVALPAPGNWRQFCTQAARIHSRPLDLTRPPWEMTVIEGLDNVEGLPPGCFAIVMKVHHAAIDGVSGTQIVTAMHDETPEGAERPPAREDWQGERPDSAWQLLAKAGMHTALSPVHAARLAARQLPNIRLRRRRSASPPRSPVPRTRFNERVSAHKVFDMARCDLADMRKIKSAVPGATVNDAALAIVGGAMRRYLSAKGELPDEAMVAVVPISTRTPEQVEVGGNQVAMMTASTGSNIADPLERLSAVHEVTQASKEAREGVNADALRDVSEVLPGALLGLAIRATALLPRAPVFANTLVTNTPGPRKPLYFNGARMVLSTGMTPLNDGMGLAHGVSSYADDFYFNITACREMLPDPEFYVECIEATIQDHLEAAG